MQTTRVPVEGILFDCDGVLVDSHESAAGAWDSWAARFAPGFDFRTQFPAGTRAADAVAGLVAPDVFHEAVADLAAEEVRCAATTGPVPGSVELANSIPSGLQGVVTSGNRSLALARLAAAGHSTPSVLVTGDDVEYGKPNGEPYRRGAELLGVPARQCVVFEDASAGVASARAAGIGYVIGVGQEVDASLVDALVANLSTVRYADGVGGAEILIQDNTVLVSASSEPAEQSTNSTKE